MADKQRTLAKEVSVSGVGLHTGVVSTLTFCPAEPNHWFKFQRTDLEAKPIINADCELVVDTSRGTTLEQNGAKVYTVEHVLAALLGCDLDNVLIKIDGPEPPIMDGSSIEFIKVLESVGFVEQNVNRKYFEVPTQITHIESDRGVEINIHPQNEYTLDVTVDYNSPVLGPQKATLEHLTHFKEEVGNCRTFCFLHELEFLVKNNLIKGGSVDNAVVIVDRVLSEDELKNLSTLFNKDIKVEKEGTLNNISLRHPNEPARHKLLDVVGDLALVGARIKGKVIANRPGHAANVALAKKIKKSMEQVENIVAKAGSMPAIVDAAKIYSMLPHRYPFQMVDKIVYQDAETVIGVKNISMNEPQFQGHFPGNPVFPGVFQIEGLAQTGGVLALMAQEDPTNYWTYFLAIESCKFKKMVVPGDQLVYKCSLLAPIKRGYVKMECNAYVNGTLVTESILSAMIVKKS
ncbi:MAG: bifunctional UDP-3-O-[3-hydroxymyristoyl] N-acetylglucosamine deacetylase/3-hydroxyacyl-ACP dehydratase [Cytophagales bacterium]